MIPGKKYDPGTRTSRRPTPEKFTHLRKWIEPVKRDVKITSISEMTNIDQQLEQSSDLFVSNIIQRVIAQLIGKYGDGFVTLEATSDGRLKVQTGGREHEVLQVAISGSYSGGVELIALNETKKIKIVNIFLVVSAAVGLKFASGAGDLTGVMQLGDTDEPRGMVCNFGAFPMETPINKNFLLNASDATNIMGYCNYYLE